MGKPIAGQNHFPYTIGGFCVQGASYNGSTYNFLNIYKQRSDCIFDLIDTSGNVYTKVQLTYLDNNNNVLNYSLGDLELVDELKSNTFYMKAGNKFISSIQLNKIKLSDGSVIYKPWDLYFCNIPSPLIDSIVTSPSNIDINIHETFNPTLSTVPSPFHSPIHWVSDNPTIATVDNNGLITGISEGSVEIRAYNSLEESTYGSIMVNVHYVPVTGVRIQNFNTLHFNSGKTSRYPVEIVPENASNKEIQLVNYHPTMFTVSMEGNVLVAVSEPLYVSMDHGLDIIAGSDEKGDRVVSKFAILIYGQDEE